ncbi:uncharacterized protein LOC114658022 isoform X2 [Erpetoichthys calabaricus]|uniref:uncharacterized protein LOC114658022 isoform X2 n=1 Tax=Erpetoichthys calabaricus TaxID=27687 RepID=UPI0022343FB2|nr:uncharacterized protein LOC114658022 isoform X2 [Erpetoichthys calabaricus]
MAETGRIRLRVVFGKDDARKMILPDHASSVDKFVEAVKQTFQIKEAISYFGEFVNITDISDIQDFGTIKVIQLQSLDSPALEDSVQSTSRSSSGDSFSVLSADSDDTLILQKPESVSSRTLPWPHIFLISRFSYETELQLEEGNAQYIAKKTMLMISSKMKSDILQKLAEEIFKFKAYPSDADFCEVSEALIQLHPFLKEPGSYNGCYGWKQRLKCKMGNYRTQLKLCGCAELTVNSLKTKADEDAYPAKNIKKPRRAEAYYYPALPSGQTKESLEKERTLLLQEMKKKNNEKMIREMMAKTFAYRRQEVVNEQPRIVDFVKRWPAFFQKNEVFFRVRQTFQSAHQTH